MGETEDFSKFFSSYFTGRVTDVEEITVNPDSGNAVEQDIYFLFENGMTLSIQDNDILCKLEDVGKEKQIQLMIRVYSPIEKCCDPDSELGFYYNIVNKWHSPTIRGIIKKIFTPSVREMIPFRRYVLLDVGIGEILLVLTKDERPGLNWHVKDFSQFYEGDCIFIKEGLLGLLDIK